MKSTDRLIPAPARLAIERLRDRGAEGMDALADDFLHGGVDTADAGAALYVAAALQVYFSRLAASLPAPSLRLLPQRGLCPCCGSTPVSGVVTETGQTRGARYLHCSLCATAWNHVRAVCITCGQVSRSVALKAIEASRARSRQRRATTATRTRRCFTKRTTLRWTRSRTILRRWVWMFWLLRQAGRVTRPNPLLLVG